MRCYNGCPDSALQAKIDDEAQAQKQLAKMKARATYFPMEGQYMVFKNNTSISGFHNTIRQAANSVIGNSNES